MIYVLGKTTLAPVWRRESKGSRWVGDQLGGNCNNTGRGDDGSERVTSGDKSSDSRGTLEVEPVGIAEENIGSRIERMNLKMTPRLILS